MSCTHTKEARTLDCAIIAAAGPTGRLGTLGDNQYWPMGSFWLDCQPGHMEEMCALLTTLPVHGIDGYLPTLGKAGKVGTLCIQHQQQQHGAGY